MIGVELFAGAGGMSLGAELAGIDVRYAVEMNDAACQTYAHNHRKTKVLCEDIQNISAVDLSIPNDDLIVFGGPPCQGFSTSNQRTRKKTNPNNWLFVQFLRLVEELEPKWVVFENVSGILQTEGGYFVQEFEERLRYLGYVTSAELLNAVEFGVPQKRTRFFMIGKRGSPPPPLAKIRKKSQPISVYDAIDDLPILANGNFTDTLPYGSTPKSDYATTLRGKADTCSGNLVSRNADHIVERYPHIPQGGNWEDIPDELMNSYSDKSRCHTGIYRRLELLEPSIVIGNFRKNMLIHPTQDRGLSVREAARLQSFPDEYAFLGSIGLQQQQVGNAVPPLLAKAVFGAVASSL